MDGHDTELDRSLLEALKGPLTHLVRNALDHGIERPRSSASRRASPPRAGCVLRAYHESGQVVVEIADDGEGHRRRPDRRDRGASGASSPATSCAGWSAREVLGLIFRPGFSTAAEVTNVSGRGVGMDVVRTNIERIGGSRSTSPAR